MIGIEHEGFFSVLLLAKAIEALDDRTAVSAILPFARRAPFELRGLRALVSASRASSKAWTWTPLSTVELPSAMMCLPVNSE